jgi:hypothetical protein
VSGFNRTLRIVRPSGQVRTENDGRSPRRAQQRDILPIGDERQVAWLRLFDSRDAQDLDVPVTFEAAIQPVGKVSEFQWNLRI